MRVSTIIFKFIQMKNALFLNFISNVLSCLEKREMQKQSAIEKKEENDSDNPK